MSEENKIDKILANVSITITSFNINEDLFKEYITGKKIIINGEEFTSNQRIKEAIETIVKGTRDLDFTCPYDIGSRIKKELGW